jgi:hypothetical protein
LRYGKGVVDLDAEVSDGALDPGVAEQELHGSQVACAPVDQSRLSLRRSDTSGAGGEADMLRTSFNRRV